MVCSALIPLTVTMVGGLSIHPQTCIRSFPAIFWLIVMSWCAALGNCSCFSWLRSEPCFVIPVGLGGNWYIFLQPQKNILIQTMAQRSKYHHQLRYLPQPQQRSFHTHHMLIYYIPPPEHASGASKCSCKLICGIKTMDTHGNALMKVPMPVSTMVVEAAVVAVQGFGGHIRLWAPLQTVGDGVLWQCQIQQEACDNCGNFCWA